MSQSIESGASGSLLYMLVSHQFAVEPEVYPHAEILPPPTKKLLSSQLAHLQPLLTGETHMTERVRFPMIVKQAYLSVKIADRGHKMAVI